MELVTLREAEPGETINPLETLVRAGLLLNVVRRAVGSNDELDHAAELILVEARNLEVQAERGEEG